MRRRFDVPTELALALMPTAIIIIVLILLEMFSSQRLLFASLASSAFLIYLDPQHKTNSIRTLIIAQAFAALIGYIIFLVGGLGYVSAAFSMIIAIGFMILTDSMHPPAVSTALLFAFRNESGNTLLLFLLALGLVVVLIILQRLSLWLVKKATAKNNPGHIH